MAALVLVNQWIEGISNNKPPLGLGYLASYLEKYLDFTDLAVVNTGTHTFERISELRPQIVGFTSYSANYPSVIRLMKRVKDELGVPTLIGGPHITCLPQELDPHADIGVVGEGEETLLELLQLYLDDGRFETAKLKQVKGIAFREGGRLRLSEPRPMLRPLDRIPFPNREILDIERFLKPSLILMNSEFLRGTTMITSRGCPFHCIYCHVSAKWGPPRYHSVDRVADEIELLVKRYGVEGIYIEDDLFTANRKRVAGIIEGLQYRNVLGKVRFFLDLRANLVSEELMQLLKKMGVVKVSLGLESGSERILQYLKGGDVSVEQNRRAVAIANKYGIGCYCCFMIGAPPETREDIVKSQKLIAEVLDASPDNSCQVSVTTPLPGTKLWEYAVERGMVREDIDWGQFSLNPELSVHPDFYVNEKIPFAEFLSLVRETTAIAGSRRLRSILRKLSWRYLFRAASDPRLAFKILRDYLTHRGGA